MAMLKMMTRCMDLVKKYFFSSTVKENIFGILTFSSVIRFKAFRTQSTNINLLQGRTVIGAKKRKHRNMTQLPTDADADCRCRVLSAPLFT